MDKETFRRALDFVKTWLQDRYEEEDVPGFVVAIAREGEWGLNQAYGLADVERQIPMSTDHIFRVASHSKTFTASAIMMLAEQGKLRIDDPVVDYIPWLSDHQDPRWRHVTIRQLLSHGAGVIRDGLDADFWYLARPFPDTARFVRELQDVNLVLDNNTKMKYTNYGYTLLGLVIEAVAGEPYNEYVLDHIVHPLGLTRTFPEYRPDLHQPDPDQMVTGYSPRQAKRRLPIRAISTQAMSPATGFCSTAADLCRYFTAQMVGSGQLLSDESKKEMQRAQWPIRSPGRPVENHYGLGFSLEKHGPRQTFGHGGGFPGCITNSQADPEEKVVVVALTNCGDGPAGAITAAVFNILHWFSEHATADAPKQDWSLLQGDYATPMGHFRILQAGDALYSIGGTGWDPLAGVEKLEHVDDYTFKIAEAGSVGSAGELVQFHVREGIVESLRYAGTLCLPAAVWRARLAQMSEIAMPT